MVVIEKLQNFQYKDKNSKDFGENVRHRAKQLAELILEPERVQEERKKVRGLERLGLKELGLRLQLAELILEPECGLERKMVQRFEGLGHSGLGSQRSSSWSRSVCGNSAKCCGLRVSGLRALGFKLGPGAHPGARARVKGARGGAPPGFKALAGAGSSLPQRV